jgi:hypothetical protein
MRTGRPPKEKQNHYTRHNISLPPRHAKMLTVMATNLDSTKSGIVQRALEVLEEKEAKRAKEVRD